MIKRSNAKIVAIVGMPGAGKTTVTDYLATRDYPRVHFGSVIMNALKSADLSPTIENETMMREELRNQTDEDKVVRQIITQIDGLIDAGQRRIIIDGMGSWHAFRALKHEFPGQLIVVALITPHHLRHRRLTKREQRPFTETQTSQRDYDEIESLNKGGVIAMADHYITNQGGIDELHEQTDHLLQMLDF